MHLPFSPLILPWSIFSKLDNNGNDDNDSIISILVLIEAKKLCFVFYYMIEK
jgi:hypothetical protein